VTPDDDALFRAFRAHDRRFDGRFFVGVRTTRIYCRPVCAARPPLRKNMRFYPSAAAAEADGFRPCLRCRPERAPGRAPVDARDDLARRAAVALEDAGNADLPLTALAARLGVDPRHLRRVFTAAYGVPPVAHVQTRRLLLAKRLLAETQLPVTEVAFASGFASVRRFNALFQDRYRATPSSLRRGGGAISDDALRFELDYRPPYEGPALLRFLAKRAVAGVERVDDGGYARTVEIETRDGVRTGVLRVKLVPGRSVVRVEASPALAPALAVVLARVRRLFDLDADPAAVSSALGALAGDAPGLRVPGAFDAFETTVRAVLGQQVSVAAATTLAGRFATKFGRAIETGVDGLTHLFPPPSVVARASIDAIAGLGIVGARAETLRALAIEMAAGRLRLAPDADVEETVARLVAIRGVGPWTAQYLALRALAWPDAFPGGDLVVRKVLGVASAREAEAKAELWRPWRAYAVMHLWRASERLP
jgi:AraC family transcriptional regulator, regulatory protein of adaptative response / DNA-3-methyladenine glycosylase II